MLTLSREYTFAAAHRIVGHEGKCNNLHGHTYRVEAHVQPLLADQSLDKLCRLVDYSALDETIGKWIKEFWDHAYLCHKDDPFRATCIQENTKVYTTEGQPTVEQLTQELLWVCIGLTSPIDAYSDKRFANTRIAKVRIWESPTSFAERTP